MQSEMWRGRRSEWGASCLFMLNLWLCGFVGIICWLYQVFTVKLDTKILSILPNKWNDTNSHIRWASHIRRGLSLWKRVNNKAPKEGQRPSPPTAGVTGGGFFIRSVHPASPAADKKCQTTSCHSSQKRTSCTSVQLPCSHHATHILRFMFPSYSTTLQT